MIHLVSSLGNRLVGCSSAVLAFCSLAISINSHSFESRLIEPVSVSAQVMRFPYISLDGVQYDTLQFAYAVEGKLGVVDVQQRSESLLCGGKRQNSTYLEVNFSAPRVVFQIRDMRSARVLLREPWQTETSAVFGKGQCQSAAEVQARFNRQRAAWERSLEQQVVDKAVEGMRDYMRNESVIQLETVDLKLFKLVNQKRFDAASEAFDLATSALSDYQQFGPTADGNELLFKAAQKWESVLSHVNDEIRGQPALQEVKRVLHRNLVAVYVVMGRYELARKHDALAIHSGMPENESLQKRILDYEKRRILSPRVSKDMVLTANLYRYGQNAVAKAELMQVESVAKLDLSRRAGQ